MYLNKEAKLELINYQMDCVKEEFKYFFYSMSKEKYKKNEKKGLKSKL